MRRLLAAAALVAVGALGLTGCATAVALDPAPQATSVACAGIIASVSQLSTLDRLPLRQTDAQGTAAWGSGPGVTLRCGVEVGVSSDPCLTNDDVDWQYTTVKGLTVLTTYGRSPATQVVIDPKAVTSDSDVLPSISDVVANETTATKHCSATGPTPTPTG